VTVAQVQLTDDASPPSVSDPFTLHVVRVSPPTPTDLHIADRSDTALTLKWNGHAEDETDIIDGVELPGADVSSEELIIQVIPQAQDEFTCYSCFLVRHRSRITRQQGAHAYWTECEG